jgi:hypothetical protein
MPKPNKPVRRPIPPSTAKAKAKANSKAAVVTRRLEYTDEPEPEPIEEYEQLDVVLERDKGFQEKDFEYAVDVDVDLYSRLKRAA